MNKTSKKILKEILLILLGVAIAVLVDGVNNILKKYFGISDWWKVISFLAIIIIIAILWGFIED